MRLTRHYTRHPEGSVLAEFGDTRVLCTASVDEKVPAFLRGKGQGWLTAEYGMLPRSTHTRSDREAARGKQSGRTQEIQRLIGRSLRAVFDLSLLGERTLQLDCDVLQADGGTRTAAITGAFVAACDAVEKLRAGGLLGASPIRDFVAAVSVGIHRGVPVLDLDFDEDSTCDTDMNVVMTGAGGVVEVQGTAEGPPFGRAELLSLLDLAADGIGRLVAAQRAALGADGPRGHRLTHAAMKLERVVLASSNAGKLRELAALLAPLGIELVAQSALGIGDADEPHVTFVENALAKARHASAASGLPAIADDSGLCIDALAGAPGVRSARWAALEGGPRSDEANNRKLVQTVAALPDCSAHYYCVLVLVRRADDPQPVIAEGVWRGRVIATPRGHGGFGYDPHFLVDALGRTAAELEPALKNELSHRGQAMRDLVARLREQQLA